MKRGLTIEDIRHHTALAEQGDLSTEERLAMMVAKAERSMSAAYLASDSVVAQLEKRCPNFGRFLPALSYFGYKKRPTIKRLFV